jgi:hypothetical protein
MTRYTPQWLQSGSYAASVDRRLLGALWPTGASSGCAVSPASAMTVNIAAGQVAVPAQNNTGVTLCSSDAVEQVTLTAAPASGSNRYDLVVCQPRGTDLDGGGNNDFIFAVVTGVAAASPSVPATPAGQLALAQIYVPGGSASVTAGNITDLRPGGLSIASAVTPRYGARYSAGAVTSPATASTAQQVPLTGGGKVYDQANAVTGSTYTCPAAGRYLVRASVSATVASGVNLQCRIYRNGALDTTYGAANAYPSTAATMVGAVALILCAVGDTLEMWWQTTATSIPIRNVANESYLAIDYLGPA